MSVGESPVGHGCLVDQGTGHYVSRSSCNHNALSAEKAVGSFVMAVVGTLKEGIYCSAAIDGQCC